MCNFLTKKPTTYGNSYGSEPLSPSTVIAYRYNQVDFDARSDNEQGTPAAYTTTQKGSIAIPAMTTFEYIYVCDCQPFVIGDPALTSIVRDLAYIARDPKGVIKQWKFPIKKLEPKDFKQITDINDNYAFFELPYDACLILASADVEDSGGIKMYKVKDITMQQLVNSLLYINQTAN